MNPYLIAHFTGATATVAIIACLLAFKVTPHPKRWVYLALAGQFVIPMLAALSYVLGAPVTVFVPILRSFFGALAITITALALEDYRRSK